MTKSDDAVLAEEIEQWTAVLHESFTARRPGRRHNPLQPLADALVSRMMQGAVRLSIMLARTDRATSARDVAGSSAAVRSELINHLNDEGKLLRNDELSDGYEVQGILFGGFRQSQLALITVGIRAGGANQAHISMRAVSKEGIIPQHVARQAIQNLDEMLSHIPA